MKILFSSQTDQGVSREHNEDFFLNIPEHACFMIADGMGGYQCGDLASKMALESIKEYIETTTPANEDFTFSQFKSAIDYANSSIYKYHLTNPDIKSMGTTFVSILQTPSATYTFHIGDSRVYRLRGGELTQLTKDHSAESELPAFMQSDTGGGKYSSVITRAVGTNESVKADLEQFQFEEGDLYLMCSDGLYSMMESDKITELMSAEGTLNDKCTALIKEANDNGGEDNISVTLVQVKDISEDDTSINVEEIK